MIELPEAGGHALSRRRQTRAECPTIKLPERSRPPCPRHSIGPISTRFTRVRLNRHPLGTRTVGVPVET